MISRRKTVLCGPIAASLTASRGAVARVCLARLIRLQGPFAPRSTLE